MKKFVMLGIIGAAAISIALPLSLASAQAQSALSSPTSCGYIPYGTSYAAPCGIYSSSYAIAYERLSATAAPYGFGYAAPYRARLRLHGTDQTRRAH